MSTPRRVICVSGPESGVVAGVSCGAVLGGAESGVFTVCSFGAGMERCQFSGFGVGSYVRVTGWSPPLQSIGNAALPTGSAAFVLAEKLTYERDLFGFKGRVHQCHCVWLERLRYDRFFVAEDLH